MNHLQSYREIKEKLEKAKTDSEEYVNFVQSNNPKLVEYSKGYEPSNQEAKTLFEDCNKKIEKTNNSTHELRKLLEKLYYELKDGTTVKGKCGICEKSLS